MRTQRPPARTRSVPPALAGLLALTVAATGDAQAPAPPQAGVDRADTVGGFYRAPDGVRVHYTVAGSGPAVVLVHGFLNDGTSWPRVPVYGALLDAGFRVVTVDLRGNGASDHPARLAAYTGDAEARDVSGIAAALGLGEYAAVGYSRGSIIVSRLLVRDPRVRAAVLGGMGADFTDPAWPRRSAVYRVLAGRPIAPDSAAPFAGMLQAVERRGLDRRVLALQQQAQPSTSPAELARVRRPVLVLAGDVDREDGSAAALAQLIPNAAHATVPGDHGSALRSGAFADSVVAFLRARTPARLGDFAASSDVGAVAQRGAAAYDPVRQTYAVSGAGANMWADRDAFHFVWRRMTGDFILTARARLLGRGGDPHRKLGWTVRPSLAPDAPHATLAVHGDGLAALQYRRQAGAQTEEQRAAVTAPDVIQLERRGDTFLMSVARAGDTLSTARTVDVPLGDTVYVGMFVCAHDSSAVERATFRDVRVTVPARPDAMPPRHYLGATLELLDVATGDREVVYRAPTPMQAPNWTRDGRALLYNDGGRMYRFDLAARTPAVVNTGEATNNNNDHVLSFDGRTLAISHHVAEEEGRSVVYTVPARGGTPTRVTPPTPVGPSYLHGWSPDGRFLVYTAQRNGDYDVYRIPAAGGAEVRLTTTPGLDDGPEYSPDGRWVYFNSVRGGSMQLWRMRPDGSAAEQVTNDGLNNWFPHLSPDGRWIAFLSFGRDVAPGDHPWYKHVYLRVMPAAGGPARVVAYVYGGQGTINVPSWAPDSRRLAFVSNSEPLGAPR